MPMLTEMINASIKRLIGMTVLTLPPGPMPDRRLGRIADIEECLTPSYPRYYSFSCVSQDGKVNKQNY